MPKLRHANNIATHAKKMDETWGGILCFVHSKSLCWHSVGMPQLGHLLVRPGVLNISSILNYFDIISYISYIVPTAPILKIQVFFQGGCRVDLEHLVDSTGGPQIHSRIPDFLIKVIAS